MKNFFKGIAVGIFNIIPGLSGCALLVVFNLYEKCLEAISSMFKKPKENFLFLFPIGLGIIVGTCLFGSIILFLLKEYPTVTYAVFTLFIIGTIPSLFKEAMKKGFKYSYIIPFIITFFIGSLFAFIDAKNLNYTIEYNTLGLIKYSFIGFVLSFATIIPGISSTVILSITNLYGVYIYSISTLNMFVLIPITICFIITTFFISKIINYLLKQYYSYTYFAILGFCISTIICFIKVII